VKPSVPDRLPTGSVATATSRYLPGVSTRLASRPVKRSELAPLLPAWEKLPRSAT
jgi:hypothetical protein